MRTQADFDEVYKKFVTKVKAHHNADPLIVKAVGKYALINLEYLIKRAKLELEIYVEQKTTESLKIDNKPKEVHTFKLKGKPLANRKADSLPPIPKHPPTKTLTQKGWSSFKKLCKTGTT